MAKKIYWSQNRSLLGPIEKSNLSYERFIEMEYINNIPYILLSGRYHCECYNNDASSFKIYKDNKTENAEHDIVNLFNKNNKIYLIDADNHGFIDMNKYLVLKEYKGRESEIYGIEKIKIENSEELITYDQKCIKIWRN